MANVTGNLDSRELAIGRYVDVLVVGGNRPNVGTINFNFSNNVGVPGIITKVCDDLSLLISVGELQWTLQPTNIPPSIKNCHFRYEIVANKK